MKILFVQTGGTIDKDYAKVWRAYAFEIEGPAVTRVLKRVKPTFEHRVETVCRKDSMDLTDHDRKQIFNACADAPETHIIITHGTDTMVQTAKALSSIEGKTIVMTGSARPERFENTDAHFNVGVAVGAVELLSPGVYIAMNGAVSRWDKVRKDPKTGRFLVV